MPIDNERWQYWSVRNESEPESEALILAIRLPESPEALIESKFVIRSKKEYLQAMRLQGNKSVTLVGQQSVIGGDVCALSTAENARVTVAESVYGNELSQWEANIICGDTFIRFPAHDVERNAPQRLTHVYVTANPHLVHYKLEMPTPDGALSKPELHADLQARFHSNRDQTEVCFEHLYEVQNSGTTTVRTAWLAARIPDVDIGESPDLCEAIYTEIDDFLLLVA